MKTPRLVVVVRADLDRAQRAVQAAHAAVDFCMVHPEAAAEWHRTSNTLAILEAPLGALRDLLVQASADGVPACPFHEPDMGGALTAVALGPHRWTRRLTRTFPPALSERRVPLAQR